MTARKRCRAAADHDPYGGGDCLGGCFGRWYVVGHRERPTGPLPPSPVILASCAGAAEARALAARLRRLLPQYARVTAERAGR
jgi:hypothetical protein